MRVDLEDKEIYQDFIKTILGFRSYYTCTDMKDKKKSLNTYGLKYLLCHQYQKKDLDYHKGCLKE